MATISVVHVSVSDERLEDERLHIWRPSVARSPAARRPGTEPGNALQRETDLQPPVLERPRQELTRPSEPVEDGVAVREESPRGTRGAEALAYVDAQGLAKLLIGHGQLTKGSPHALPGSLLLLDREGHQLHVLVARQLESLGHAMHQPLRREGVEMATSKPLHPSRAR